MGLRSWLRKLLRREKPVREKPVKELPKELAKTVVSSAPPKFTGAKVDAHTTDNLGYYPELAARLADERIAAAKKRERTIDYSKHMKPTGRVLPEYRRSMKRRVNPDQDEED